MRQRSRLVWAELVWMAFAALPFGAFAILIPALVPATAGETQIESASMPPAESASSPTPPPTQQSLPIAQVYEETKKVKTAVDAIKFYLQDRQALAEGKAPKGWELPELEEYEKMNVPGSLIPAAIPTPTSTTTNDVDDDGPNFDESATSTTDSGNIKAPETPAIVDSGSVHNRF